MTSYLIFFIILILIATLAWLNQTVKQAVVEPVINGKLPLKILSEKKRWQDLWDKWKFYIGMFIGSIVTWKVRGWLL